MTLPADLTPPPTFQGTNREWQALLEALVWGCPQHAPDGGKAAAACTCLALLQNERFLARLIAYRRLGQATGLWVREVQEHRRAVDGGTAIKWDE